MRFFQFLLRQGRIFALLVIVLPAIVGTFAYQSLPKEGEPEVSIPNAIVITPYPGASPKEIESLVTNPLEEAISNIKDIDEIRSTSAESVSIMVVTFDIEADLERSIQKVREKVTEARKDLPDDVEDSSVEEISLTDIPIMTVSVVGDMDPVRLKRLAEDVADEIELLPEVLSTVVTGGLTREIQIYMDPERLDHHGLTILDVFSAIKQSDVNIPGGMVNVRDRRFLLRTMTEIKHVNDYARVPLVSMGGRVVFLGDVGRVVDGHEEDVTYARVNGKSAVSIAVKKRAGANILETSDKVRQKAKELEKSFPEGLSVIVTADQAKFIRQTFEVMNNSAVTGLIIVIIVLFFAMGLRNSIITSLSIPLSLLITFIFLKAFGQTNNNMVRFSLILCIGLLVDNAIIVVENVYHHYQLGKDRINAVIEGVSEIAQPVISATLTTMAAFLPMLLMTGTTGEYMGYMPKTVTIALAASLIVALIANPLVLSRFLKRIEKGGRILRPEEDLAHLKKTYVRAVSWALNHRFIVVVLMILALSGALGLFALKAVEVEMFPDIDFDYIYITIETPPGSDTEITDAIARQVEEIVQRSVPEAVQVATTAGYKAPSALEISIGTGKRTNFAEVTVELQDGKEFARASHKEIQRRIQEDLAAIPGADIRFRPLAWGGPIFAPIVIQVMGPDIETLRSISRDVKVKLSTIRGAEDIKDDFSGAPPELRVRVDREMAALLGVPLESVAMTLRAATAGLDIRDFRDELDVAKKYEVKVRYSPEARTSARMLEKVKVRSQSGSLVPLSNVASFSQEAGLNAISHIDQHRTVRVSAQNEGRSSVEITKELKEKMKDDTLPAGYAINFEGQYQETEKSFASLKLAYMVAFLLIFTLLVSQFNSYFQPLAIMTALPLSIIGAMVGLVLTGNNFSIMGFIGLVGLSGIVVNDSIVLVDCINRKRKGEGLSIFEAIVAAGQQRLRPIISTTLSTMGGIVTLTITDKLWEGLGVVIIFGIAFATVLTLVVVPVVYSLFEALGYRFLSALRGPRWLEIPEGKSFFFSRRRYARLILYFVIILQCIVLALGVYSFGPKLADLLEITAFRAPSALKLGIEIAVFYLGLAIRVVGFLLLFLIPTWGGLLFLMGRRSADGQYIDISAEGVTVTSPVEKLFLPAAELTKLHYSRLLRRLTIQAGRRKIRIRGVIELSKTPRKVPLKVWLGMRAPSRAELRTGLTSLNAAVEDIMTQSPKD